MSALNLPGSRVLNETQIDRVALDRRARSIGRILFERIGRGPHIWQRAWWDDQAMALSMSDPATKIQLFRFIDALPALRSDASVRRHLEEYLQEAGPGVPWAVKGPLKLVPPGAIGDQLIATMARQSAALMARRFIAGSTPTEALKTVLRLRGRHLAFTADLLGEAVISESEADHYQETCLQILETLTGPLANLEEVPVIDRDTLGPIPRVNLSLKLTSLTSQFDPIDPESTFHRVRERFLPILRTARDRGAYVHVDMEQFAYKNLTLEIFRRVMLEPEFRDWPDVGIVCQAYLEESFKDLRNLRDWAWNRGTPITIRLVKGAYWDYEVTHARQMGWPVPVFQQKWQSDAQYERCTQFLMENQNILRPALASHNIRSLAAGLAAAEAYGVPLSGFECQVLCGMGEPIADALSSLGVRVRVYTPYGAMLPGMAYLVRRLLENTSNESFLQASHSEDIPVEALLKNPEEIGAMQTKMRSQSKATMPLGSLLPFQNEPLTDFSQNSNRQSMQTALSQVRVQLGVEIPLLIDGKPVVTESRLDSSDPSEPSRLVARTSRANASHADQAVAAARSATVLWGSTPPAERAAVLIRAASLMRQRKFELAALEVFECAKPWREADGDVAEAIDFCEFYAREMVRLSEPQHRDVPGESNRLDFVPRGVVAVIPPWNFPLAIPCGMVVAALVAGNSVVLKPAEQSPLLAWKLVKTLEEAGLPPGVLNYLPGMGEEVGQSLVNHPGVDLVAFTGSRNIGLLINRQAAETPRGQDHVKRVIAEMGGKNAIIVDDDADLDEAVLGVVHSAFGYAGQKCSACSRVIVLEGVYNAFVSRLVEAAKSLSVGLAEDPATDIPAVIDAEARHRIEEYQRLAETEGRVVFQGVVGQSLGPGHYVAPLIVADVSPHARLAQEEIFGPILAILKARDLDHAITIANGTEYALTGGIYSRSPAHIHKFCQLSRVGNLYINRSITGAMVNRQPFGGFKLSGIGTKAGGPDYLREFLISRTVTENTMRRGFAPEPEAGGVPDA